MILGFGVDIVDVARFGEHLDATPGLRERLFTAAERNLELASLAARFAAKEATIKAFGGPIGSWHDVWVDTVASGQPVLQFDGDVLAAAATRGVTSQHVSLSHDGGVAIATVILEGGTP